MWGRGLSHLVLYLCIFLLDGWFIQILNSQWLYIHPSVEKSYFSSSPVFSPHLHLVSLMRRVVQLLITWPCGWYYWVTWYQLLSLRNFKCAHTHTHTHTYIYEVNLSKISIQNLACFTWSQTPAIGIWEEICTYQNYEACLRDMF